MAAPAVCPDDREQLEAVVIRMADENRDWGYRRIQGALANLGHLLAHNTIAKILKQDGVDPAPERSQKTTWKEFLNRHWEQIVASDLFTVEVWTKQGSISRNHSLFGFINARSRPQNRSPYQFARHTLTGFVAALVFCALGTGLLAETGRSARPHIRPQHLQE